MSTRILLAVDGSPASDAATRWVAARSDRPGTTVDVASVATDYGVLRDAAKEAVGRAATTLAESSPAAWVMTSVPNGNVFDTLLEMSDGVDLVVIGSDRPQPIVAAFHGTMPMRLCGRVECDLAVVPRGWTGSSTGPVLAGWDDEPGAYTVVDAAAEEATAMGVRLRMVHVWAPVATSPYGPEGSGDLITGIERERTRLLDEAAASARIRHPGIEITTELHLGSIVGGLLERAQDASLIVVGSHKRSGLGEIVFGSTGDAVIRHSEHTPILVAGRSRQAANAV